MTPVEIVINSTDWYLIGKPVQYTVQQFGSPFG